MPEFFGDPIRKPHRYDGTDESIAGFLAELQRWRVRNRKIVFTNGCFDVFHPGHARLLNWAARTFPLSVLIVGLNSDASVYTLKGDGRPVICEEDRAFVLLQNRPVDQVVIFYDPTPEALIRAISPDVLVKGEDWAGGNIAGSAHVAARGGTVAFAPRFGDYSTTKLLGGE